MPTLVERVVSCEWSELARIFWERWLSGLRQQPERVAMRETASEVRILPLSVTLCRRLISVP